MTTLAQWRESMLAPFDISLFPFLTPGIRIEEAVERDQYLVRAELPGIDPTADLDITVTNGVLRIQAQRSQTRRTPTVAADATSADQRHEREHSEFHYGRLVRTVPLPVGADEATAVAHYAGGILEIRMAIGEPRAAGRQIPVETESQTPRSAPGKPKK